MAMAKKSVSFSIPSLTFGGSIILTVTKCVLKQKDPAETPRKKLLLNKSLEEKELTPSALYSQYLFPGSLNRW